MDNLILSVKIVTPLLIMMLVGVLLRVLEVIDDHDVKKINRITFFVAVPTMCFRSVVNADLSGIRSAGTVLAVIAGMIVVSFLLLALIVPRFEKKGERRGVLIQAMYRPNEAVFGIPIVTALLGADNLTLMALTIAVSVPLFNFGGVLALELFRDEKSSFGHVLKKIATNPIIIGVVLGLVLNVAGIRLPEVLMSPINSIANMSTPLAFIVLGASLSFEAIKLDRVTIGIATLVRLFIMPALALGTMALFGYMGEPMIVTLVAFGAPTALSSFALAMQLGGDTKLASGIIAATCVLSLPSMVFWLFLLMQLGWI